MTEVKYTQAQIEELKSNKYVKNVTHKHIVFKKEFKIKAIELYDKYMSSKYVFEKMGFPNYVISSDIPKSSISRWKKNIKQKGVIEEKKGRAKKEKVDFDNMSKEQYIEYLETKLALYEELADYMKTGLP